jgi:hypothetical protein
MIDEAVLIKVRRNRDKIGCETEIVACGKGREEQLTAAWFAAKASGDDDWLQDQLQNLPTVIAEHWPRLRDLFNDWCGEG